MKLKILGLALVAVIVSNLILYILKIINGIVFWSVLIIVAIIAYKVLPYLKKKKEK